MGVHGLICFLSQDNFITNTRLSYNSRQILNRRPMQAAGTNRQQGNGAIYFALNHAVLSWNPLLLTLHLCYMVELRRLCSMFVTMQHYIVGM